jgi:glucarate dehydratase
MINALEQSRLEFVEQPVMAQDLAGLAHVRRRVATAICADQAARTPDRVLATVAAAAADVISVCPGDAGGLLLARKASAIAEAAGIPVLVHSNIELGVATAAHLHLAASLPNCHYASQTEHQFLADDVLREGSLAHRGGCYGVPTGPGLGVEVDEARVALYHEAYLRAARVQAPARPAFVTSLPGY